MKKSYLQTILLIIVFVLIIVAIIPFFISYLVQPRNPTQFPVFPNATNPEISDPVQNGMGQDYIIKYTTNASAVKIISYYKRVLRFMGWEFYGIDQLSGGRRYHHFSCWTTGLVEVNIIVRDNTGKHTAVEIEYYH